jgi:type II secretory pathway component PulJ
MKMIRKKLKGLSLIEVITSIGVFSLMMVTIAGIFGSSISSSRSNRVIERNIENAQFVMNEMAKELRTSTVVDTNLTFDNSGAGTFASPGISNHIQFFDYSQSKCIRYRTDTVNGNFVIKRAVPSVATADPTACASATMDVEQIMTTGDVVPSFRVVTSFDGKDIATGVIDTRNARVGLVTMVFVVKEKAAATQSVTLQTTVSLRDYAKSGIIH